MVDQDPENDVNIPEDAVFHSSFEEFAAKRAGLTAPAPDPDEEGQAQPEAKATEGEPQAGVETTPEPAQPEAGGEPTSGQTAGAEEAPAEKQPANDPWASAPPEVIAERDRLMEELNRTRHQARSDANRVAALSRKLDTLSRVPEKPEATEAQKALDDKLDQLEQEFPTVGGPIKEAFQAQRDKLGELERAVTAQTVDQVVQAQQREAEALSSAHPDWTLIAADQSWKDWVAHQAPGIQAIANSSYAAEVSVALNLFKMERVAQTGQTPAAIQPKEQAPAPKTDERRSRQLEGGADVRSKTPAPASGGAPDEFDAAFEHFSKLREQKRLAGSAR
jgi:hypothetical protein